MNPPLKLYNELASWWPLLSPLSESKEEANLYSKITSEAMPQAKTVLELGSGGGNNAYYMKNHFHLTLVDASKEMLQMSQTLNPECAHLQGDMRLIRLNRQFDVVFIHDAIMYMVTEQDLKQAIETAFIHCRPGGIALLIPDYIRETFKPSTGFGGHDSKNRAIRYLKWSWDPDPNDSHFISEFAYLFRYSDQSIQIEHDHHDFGLFSEADWNHFLTQTGFQSKTISLASPDNKKSGKGFLAFRPFN